MKYRHAIINLSLSRVEWFHKFLGKKNMVAPLFQEENFPELRKILNRKKHKIHERREAYNRNNRRISYGAAIKYERERRIDDYKNNAQNLEDHSACLFSPNSRFIDASVNKRWSTIPKNKKYKIGYERENSLNRM